MTKKARLVFVVLPIRTILEVIGVYDRISPVKPFGVRVDRPKSDWKLQGLEINVNRGRNVLMLFYGEPHKHRSGGLVKPSSTVHNTFKKHSKFDHISFKIPGLSDKISTNRSLSV